MMSAWQYAEIGPFTLSPAAQFASSDTVIFWSASVVETITQVTTPAITMMIPTTMDVLRRVEGRLQTRFQPQEMKPDVQNLTMMARWSTSPRPAPGRRRDAAFL